MASGQFGDYVLNLLANASAIMDNKPVPAQVESFCLRESYLKLYSPSMTDNYVAQGPPPLRPNTEALRTVLKECSMLRAA